MTNINDGQNTATHYFFLANVEITLCLNQISIFWMCTDIQNSPCERVTIADISKQGLGDGIERAAVNQL
jgi:hypothetical protein